MSISEKINLKSSFMLSVGVVSSGLTYAQAQSISEKPNVVIIYTDDVGYGDLGCYGATKVRTPNIDRLAESGCLFTDAHSASAVSTPSRYCLITGEYAFRKDIYGPIGYQTPLLIDSDQTTIADVMKISGYSTALIGKWHLGLGIDKPDWNSKLSPGPLELGFDYFFGIPTVSSHPPFFYVENHFVYGYDQADPVVLGVKAKTKEFPEKFDLSHVGGATKAHQLFDDEKHGTELTGRAVDWIKKNKDRPFFLLYCTPHIHHPFTPDPKFRGTSDAGRYGDYLHELDWITGEIIKTLDELGITNNTLLIFTSDNGGMLNQGGQDAWSMGHRLNGDLLGFKFDAWEGGHRVPFIARWPGKIKPGSKSSILIANIDLLATMAALTGYELKKGEGPDSYNILPTLISDSSRQIRDHLVIAPSRPANLTLRKNGWVYISSQGGGGFTAAKPGDHGFGGPPALQWTNEPNSDIADGKIKPDAAEAQLYNLINDPSQSKNVIRENQRIAASMKNMLEQIKSGSFTRPTN